MKKIKDFIKGIKCSHIQNDYRQIKDLPQYTIFIAIIFSLSTLTYLFIMVPPVLNHSLIELLPVVISSYLCEQVLLGILNFEHEIAHWYLTVFGPH